MRAFVHGERGAGRLDLSILFFRGTVRGVQEQSPPENCFFYSMCVSSIAKHTHTHTDRPISLHLGFNLTMAGVYSNMFLSLRVSCCSVAISDAHVQQIQELCLDDVKIFLDLPGKMF